MTRSAINTFIAAYLVSAGIIITVGTQVVVYNLDTATAVQCKNHAWPAAKHQAHMAWCADNNYSTN